jgi:tetrapyrrole methylase family protein/MazG family protein
MTERSQAFENLCQIMHRLRAPGGCPWDREQTHSTLIKYLIEEAYEVIEAIEQGDDSELLKELGDLLLQVVFHAEIAAEENRFTLEQVIESVNEKMVRRHPHVFGDAQAEDAEAVLKQWEAIKQKEKGETEKAPSVLDGVPESLPALLKAHRIQSRAAQVGFDWEHPREVLAKVREELDELEVEVENGSSEKTEEEFGDLLFALVNWARFQGLDSERALQSCNRKFRKRFEHIERSLAARGSSVRDADIEEMDALWNEAKTMGEGR